MSKTIPTKIAAIDTSQFKELQVQMIIKLLQLQLFATSTRAFVPFGLRKPSKPSMTSSFLEANR